MTAPVHTCPAGSVSLHHDCAACQVAFRASGSKRDYPWKTPDGNVARIDDRGPRQATPSSGDPGHNMRDEASALAAEIERLQDALRYCRGARKNLARIEALARTLGATDEQIESCITVNVEMFEGRQRTSEASPACGNCGHTKLDHHGYRHRCMACACELFSPRTKTDDAIDGLRAGDARRPDLADDVIAVLTKWLDGDELYPEPDARNALTDAISEVRRQQSMHERLRSEAAQKDYSIMDTPKRSGIMIL